MKKTKLNFGDWLDKYFEKDNDHLYYTCCIPDGMHPNDQTRWKDDDLLNEYERYLSNDPMSDIGLDKYGE